MRTNLVLAALAVVLGVFSFVTVRGEYTPVKSYKEIKDLLPGFNPETINVVSIARQKQPDPAQPQQPNQQPELERLLFIRTGVDTWQLGPGSRLTGLPIRKHMVERQIFDHLAAIKLDPKALATPDADQEYRARRHLTEESGLLIVCGKDIDRNTGQLNSLAEVIKGVRAETLTNQPGAVEGYFVCRRDNPQQVVIYDPTHAWEPSLDANMWVDKVIHDFELGKVESFTVDRPGILKAGFRRPTGSRSWEAMPGMVPKDAGPVRFMEAQSMIEAFQKITAEAYVAPLAQARDRFDALGLKPGHSQIEISAKLDDDLEYWMRIGHQLPGENYYYAVASGSTFLFKLPSHVVNAFRKTPLDLYDPKPQKPAEKDPPKKAGDDKSGEKATTDKSGEKATTDKSGEKATTDKSGDNDSGGNKEEPEKKTEQEKSGDTSGKTGQPAKTAEKKSEEQPASRKSGEQPADDTGGTESGGKGTGDGKGAGTDSGKKGNAA